jgi:hypothetical protein
VGTVPFAAVGRAPFAAGRRGLLDRCRRGRGQDELELTAFSGFAEYPHFPAMSVRDRAHQGKT